MKTLKLAVNLDAAAQACSADLAQFAQTAAHAGADAVAVTVRPAWNLSAQTLSVVKTELDARSKTLILIGNPDWSFAGLLREVKPAAAVLVPDEAEKSATDCGFDLTDGKFVDEVRAKVASAKVSGACVFLALDPDPDLMDAAKDAEADGVALLALGWEAAAPTPLADDILLAYQDSAASCFDLDREVALMTGLTLENAQPILSKCPAMETAVFTAPAEAVSSREALARYVRELAAVVEKVNAHRRLHDELADED